MSHALENLVRTILAHENGILFLEWPTGSGKTTNITEALASIIKGEKKIPYIFFLTPENKNVDSPFKELRALFGEEEQALFDKYCLRLKANSDQVIDTFLSVLPSMPEQISKTQPARKLREAIESIEEMRSKKSKFLNTDSIIQQQREAIAEKLEPDFRRELHAFLEKVYPNEKRRKEIALDEYPWIKEIYPSSLVYEKRVIFLSVKKFLLPIDPIIAPAFLFEEASFVKGARVLFDEIDSACRTVRMHQIDQAKEAQVDLIDFFTRLHGMREIADFPSELLEDAQNASPKAATQQQSFEQIKQRADLIYDTYHLKWNFRIDDEGIAKSFLYSNEETHIVYDGQAVADVAIKPVKKETLNRLVASEEPLQDRRKGVKWMLGDMYGALKYIAKIVASISLKYMNLYNGKNKGKKEMLTIDQSINAVVSNFHLDEKGSAVLQKMAMSAAGFRKRKSRVNLFSHDFYMEGYRFYNFVNDQNDTTRTAINMIAMDETPEKFLLSICSKFFVVGISATATNPSRITNFNHEYIKRYLGDSVYTLSQEDVDEFLKYHRQKQLKKPKPRIVVMRPKEETESLVGDLFKEKANIRYFTDDLEKRFSKYVKSDFDRRRFSMMSSAIKDFLEDPTKKVILVMIGRAIREDDGTIYSLPFWSKLCESIALEIGISAPDVRSLVGKTFLEEKSKYQSKAREKGKIVLFSTYPSVATGQNLFYLDEFDIKRDISCIFVEKPMSIVPNIKSKNVFVTLESLMEFFSVVEILNKNYEITDASATSNIKAGFIKFKMPFVDTKTKGKKLTETDSVNYSMVQILEQSIGRLNRTEDDSKKTLYVDPEIIDAVDFSCIAKKELNIELRALMEVATSRRLAERTEEARSLRLSKICDSCRAKIERQLHTYDQSWTREEMDVWSAMREELLRHPTYPTLESASFLMQPMMIPSPNEKPISSYSYKISEKEPNYVFSADAVAHKLRVSSEECFLSKLMAIEPLRAEFESNGYATSFKPGLAIVNPVAYTNIYKGAIGEVVIKYLLAFYKIILKPIDDPKKFELFDFEIEGNPDVYIDCKHWLFFDPDSKEQIAKIHEKAALLGAKRAVIVNLIRPQGATDFDDGIIFFSKGLLEDTPRGLEVNREAIMALRAAIQEAAK